MASLKDHFSRILSLQEVNKIKNISDNVIEQDFKKEADLIDSQNKNISDNQEDIKKKD